ncbi:MAG: hypothetical protein FGM38_01315, partial [Solirubrobacterales bacterium]|nr:hypothetical protein [Solirubrobacterales bacterium]
MRRCRSRGGARPRVADGLWLRGLFRLCRAKARWRIPPPLHRRSGRPGRCDHDRLRRGGTLSDTPSLRTEFCGLELASPILNGSGTFDAIAARRVFGDEAVREGNFPFAAYVSKTITEEARVGNPPFRTWETPAGMINSIGLPNLGLEGFLEAQLPELRELPVPLIVSVMASDRDGFARIIDRLSAAGGIDGFELNVSCPNVHSGLIVGERPEETAGLLEQLRPLTERPLIVKLTPNVASPEWIASAAEAGGADAVSLVNTLKATAIGPESDRPWLGAGSGG